jgi:FkbM family methyltransferase
MLGKLLIRAGDYLCRSRDRSLIGQINKAIRILYLRTENANADIATNGEERVLRLASAVGLKTYFDVGANHGDWTDAVRKHNTEAVIHCFEISPEAFQALGSRTKQYPNVFLHNLGMFSTSGTMKFYQNANDRQSSLIASEKQRDSRLTEASVVTLDDFADEHGIHSIDFLKIDTEGADYDVLKGAEKMLRSGAIKVIQFEYGFASVDSGHLLKDFYAYLEPLGYRLGKIYPRSVDFTSYSRGMENFIGPNFLAVRNELGEMIRTFK